DPDSAADRAGGERSPREAGRVGTDRGRAQGQGNRPRIPAVPGRGSRVRQAGEPAQVLRGRGEIPREALGREDRRAGIGSAPNVVSWSRDGMSYYWLVPIGALVRAFGTLIGAGGGFLLVPLLLLLYPGDQPETITSISLAGVFFNAFSGSIAYARMK